MKNIDFVTVIFVGFLLFAFAIYYVVARAAHYPAHTLTDEQINLIRPLFFIVTYCETS